MIKTIIVFLMLLGTVLRSQVGILTQSPTNVLDVNGDVRVRTLADQMLPGIPQVLTADNNGVLQQAIPIEVLYSSGLYTRGNGNNYWSGIYVGTKACRLDFTGRIADYALDLTFSVFYKIGTGFQVVSQNIVTVTPQDATSFNVTWGDANYLFQFTLSGNTASVHAVKTSGGGYWSQGTFRSIPIVN